MNPLPCEASSSNCERDGAARWRCRRHLSPRAAETAVKSDAAKGRTRAPNGCPALHIAAGAARQAGEAPIHPDPPHPWCDTWSPCLVTLPSRRHSDRGLRVIARARAGRKRVAVKRLRARTGPSRAVPGAAPAPTLPLFTPMLGVDLRAH
jgi:hypothetical protein